MTFGELYRDVYSRLALDGENHDVYFDDISKAINDAIREVRVQYIRQGMGHEFATTETLTSFSEDPDYPNFVRSDTLSNKIMEDLPIEYTVLSSTCYITSNAIENTIQTFSEGDIARKDGKMYECVESFSGVNTYDLTFDPQEVRNYYRSNGLVYDVGDVVYDIETDGYFKVNTGFTNNKDEDGDTNSNLDKLYWKEIGTAYAYASHYPHKYLNTIRLYESIDFSEAFSILEDKVYATRAIEELTLTYISKWNDVNDMDVTLDLPDFMIPAVKDQTLMVVGQKLNVKMQALEQKREQTDGE